MRIVGIIGPYYGDGNRRVIDHNIVNAQYVMIKIANYFAENRLVGFFAPHSHTARFEKLAKAPESYYHDLDATIYKYACDGMVLLPGWEKSAGARRDRDHALLRHWKSVFELKSYEDRDVDALLRSLEIWARQ